MTPAIVDHEAALRCAFLAEKQDEAADRAWARWLSRPRVEHYAEPSAAPVLFRGADEPARCCWRDELAELSDADRAFAESAEGAYLQHCRERTGEILPEEVLEKARGDAAALLDLNRRLAEKLTAAGWDAWRETPFDLFRVYIHSGEVEFLESFRRSTILPLVAQQLRGPLLSTAEHWLSCHPFARFWTFTTGKPCRVEELTERLNWLNARLRALADSEIMKSRGLRFALTAIELGTAESKKRTTAGEKAAGQIRRDHLGRPLFHPHAHCIVEMESPLPAAEWSALLSQVHQFWDHFWFEGGAIQSARECIKYLTKPAEMLKLSGAELRALQEVLCGRRLIRPLGSLKEEMRRRRAKRRRLLRKKTGDGRVYSEVKDWNKWARQTRDEKAIEFDAKKAAPKELRRELAIVSRSVPRYGKAGVSEPTVTVRVLKGMRPTAAQVRGHALVRRVYGQTWAKYRDGVAMLAAGVAAQAAAAEGARAINVHTRTPTAGEPSESERRWRKSGLHRAPLGAQARGF